MASYETETRVNGAYLPLHLRDRVVILGTPIKTHPSGKSMEMKTSDNRLVTINMVDPLDSILKGVVEVHGVATGKDVIECDRVITFLPEHTERFDMEAYDKAVNFIGRLPNPWRI